MINPNLGARIMLVYAWAVFIAVLLLTPFPGYTESGSMTFYDKILHGIIFGIFAFLLYYCFEVIGESKVTFNPVRKIEKKPDSAKKIIKLPIRRMLAIFMTAIFISISYSILLEHLQIYVPGRTPDDFDLLAGVIGVLLALLFVYGNNYFKK